VSFKSVVPTRFVAVVQLLSDPTPLFGRSIAYLRLAGSHLVEEGGPLPVNDHNLQPPPLLSHLRAHPKTRYPRLVAAPISRPQSTTSHASTSI
jgi:hypothetical protein